MKKLLVLALTVIFVLSLGAIVLADAPVTTFHGEIDGAWNTTSSTSGTGGQITVDSAIAKNVSFEAELTFGYFDGGWSQASTLITPMDHYFVSVDTGYGVIKTGYVDNWTGSVIDVLSDYIADEGKSGTGTNLIYSYQISKPLSFSVGYDYEASCAGLLVDWTGDNYGVEFASAAPKGQNASYGFNLYYKPIDGVKVWSQLALASAVGMDKSQGFNYEIGANYNKGTGLWAEAEYEPIDATAASSATGSATDFEVGYIFQPGVNFFVRDLTNVSGSTTYAFLCISY